VPEPGRPPTTPRDAASLILVRDGADGVEVLLLQRHPESRFSPGAFAFPGGRIEPSDSAAGIERLCRGLGRAEAAARLAGVRPPERAIAFWVAGLREAFEEAGLLLAVAAAGGAPGDAVVRAAVLHRARSREDAATFAPLLEELGLVLPLDRLGYWAHWITPEERAIRYDTRFFVAEAPSGQTPDPDGREVVGWRWLPPGEALRRHAAGEMTLPFPTQRILASLAGPPDARALLAAAATRVVASVRPRVITDPAGDRILVPGDPGWF
jgi:8-oxo-dGTP pyrophosphatase MutT (NUDIX family)